MTEDTYHAFLHDLL